MSDVRLRWFRSGGNFVITDRADIDSAQASGQWIRLEAGGEAVRP